MPLDTADTADTFADTPPTDDTTTGSYPPAPPLAPLSFLLGYSESGRTRYTTLQCADTTRLLSLPLTHTEIAGLTYYGGILYAYESYGDVLGTGAGALLGLALRSRKPGRVPAAVARMFGVSPRIVAVAMRVGVFGSLGRLYGMTTAGVQALNRMRAEQRADANMGRVVAARTRRVDALASEIRARALGGRQQQGGEEERDEQSLGGVEVRGGSGDEAFPYGRPSELVAEQQQQQPEVERQTERGDDPFSFVDGSEAQQQQQGAPVKGGWKNNHSSTTGESAWERLRKGQQQQQPPSEDEPQSQSPWPRRQPMKGFGSPEQSNEPKTDSFSFSSTAEDRELAKAQAQKEFDESLERERRSGGGDGEGYSEGDQGRGGRGRW